MTPRGLRLQVARARLHERGEQLRDVALVRLQVALQEGVEVDEQQPVHADHARHQRGHRQARLEALATAALQPRKHLLRKRLPPRARACPEQPA